MAMWRSRQEKVLHIACNLLLRVELNGGEDEVYSSTFICWAPESGMVHGTLKCPLPTALAPFAGWLPRTERLDCGFIWKVALDIPRSAVQVNQLCIASPSSLGCLLGHFVEARYFWWRWEPVRKEVVMVLGMGWGRRVRSWTICWEGICLLIGVIGRRWMRLISLRCLRTTLTGEAASRIKRLFHP